MAGSARLDQIRASMSGSQLAGPPSHPAVETGRDATGADGGVGKATEQATGPA